MGAHDNDRERDRQREKALARRLAQAFDNIAASSAGDCPDADQIAAYHQRALSQEENTQCESHFAACTRCRKILTVLAASAEAPLAERPLTHQEVAKLGEFASAVHRRPTAKSQRVRSFPWRFPWLVPAFGVAAALAVWFIVRPPWRLAAPDSSQVLIAQSPKATVPAVGQDAAPAAEALNAPARDAAAPAQPRSSTMPQTLQTPAAESDRLDKLAAVDGAANQALKDEQTVRESIPLGVVGGVSGDRIGAPETPQQTAAPAAPPRPANAAPFATEGEIRAMRQQAAPAAAGARANAPLVAAYAASAGFSVLLQSPSSAVSWRAGTAGRIERSLDGGRTWQAQQSPLRENWLAGSAVTDVICWLVGANGAIARTLDGMRWERIAPPPLDAAAGSQPDWVVVASSSAQTATITAGDQQRYTTQDGGRTWRKQ